MYGFGQQGQFKLESGNDEVESELNVPKGNVTIEDEYTHLVSEDGKVDFRLPRTDLVKPSVQSAYANGIYTYVITNDIAAKRPIQIIRFVSSNNAAKEVAGDPRLKFGGTGWIAGTSGGLLPGETMTLKVRGDGMKIGKIEMQFMSDLGDFELPPETPYGLRVLMRNHLKVHDHVGVVVTGPK
jgi:hypothetical protein